MSEFAFSPDLLFHLLLTLLHSVWQIGLFALIVIVCGRLLPGKSVEWRYAFHVVALLAALLALPVTFWMIQGSDPSAVELVSMPVGSSNITVKEDSAADGSAVPPLGRLPMGGVADISATVPISTLHSDAAVDVTLETEANSRTASDKSWLTVLAIWASAIYLLGVVTMLTRLLISMLRVNRLARAGTPIGDTPATRVLQRLSHCWSMRVVPRLLVAEQCVVPQVVGLIQPAILLPASALSGLSASELEMILAHELAHLRRHDLWVNLIQRLAEAVLFFNPGLWYLSNRISVLREYCCDESAVVLVHGGHSESARLRYAQALLRVVELEQGAEAQKHLASLAAVGRSPSELRKRVARLFGESLEEPLRLSRGGVALIAAAVILLSCGTVFSNRQLRMQEDLSAKEAFVEVQSGDIEPSEDMVQIRLQHGGTLRLHALTSPTNPAMGWWSPKGRKIDAKEDWTRHRNNWADTELIAIMEAVPPGESPASGPDGERWKMPMFFVGRVRVSDAGDPTTVGGFGAGPWSVLGKVGVGESLGGPNFSAKFTKLESLGQNFDSDGRMFPAPLISCEVQQVPKLDFALIAVDKKGTRARCGVTYNPSDSYESKKEVWKLWQSTQGGVDANDFSHLEVQTRKRAWAEFSGFAIQPKLVESGPTVRRLPAIAKKAAAKSDKNDTPAKVSGTIVLEDGSPAAAKGWMYTDVRKGQGNNTLVTKGTQDQFMDEFSFEIGSGEVHLTHFADGYAPAWTEKFDLAVGEQCDGIRLALKRGFSAPVLVRDELGQPVPGATVIAVPEIHGEINAPNVKHITDKNGEVQLQHLANTRYQLKITAPGFQPLRTAPLRIEAGESFRPTMVRSQPSTGIVRFADGTPAPSTKLRCVYEERADGKGINYGNEGDGYWGSVLTTTDVQGRFKLDQLAEGSQYVMVVEAVDGARAVVRSIASNNPDLQIVLPRRRDLFVKLEGDLSQIQTGDDKLSIDFRQRVTSVFKSGHRRGDLIGEKFPVQLDKDGRTVIFRGLAVDLDGPDAGKQKVEVFFSRDRKNKQTVDLNLEAGTIVALELPDPIEIPADKNDQTGQPSSEAVQLADGIPAANTNGGSKPELAADQRTREQIGEVLGKPIYRDDIRDGESVSLEGELHRLFISAVSQQYRQTHEEEIVPNPGEIAAAAKYFDNQHRKRIKEQEPSLRARLNSIEEQLNQKGLTDNKKKQLIIEKSTVESQLNPPGQLFAEFMLNNWKFQRHLYQEYGGGRVLWQQFGMEAFDAHRKWLEALERDGKFKINDPKLRSALYHYWTTQNHGSFLSDDKERIRKFIEPEWLKTNAQAKTSQPAVTAIISADKNQPSGKVQAAIELLKNHSNPNLDIRITEAPGLTVTIITRSKAEIYAELKTQLKNVGVDRTEIRSAPKD